MVELEHSGHTRKDALAARTLLLLNLALRYHQTVVLVAVLHLHPRIIRYPQLFLQSHCKGYGETALPLDQLVEVTG